MGPVARKTGGRRRMPKRMVRRVGMARRVGMDRGVGLDGGALRCRTRRWRQGGVALLTIATLGVGAFVPSLARAEAGAEASAAPRIHFHDVQQQTREFHAYNRSIALDAEQRRVMHEALSRLPAPCCADKSAATCCCACNLARSWWGLSKHLIADRGYDADRVREAVIDWLHFVNPDGFTGNSCYSGGCTRSFRENGCGGMDERRIRL